MPYLHHRGREEDKNATIIREEDSRVVFAAV
jgi:hypothetical protein